MDKKKKTGDRGSQKKSKIINDSLVLSQMVINSFQDGIVVHGPDLKYMLWNPFMEQMTGMTADKVIGRHPLDVFPFLKKTGVIENLEETLAGSIPDSVDFRFNVTETGKKGWCSNTCGPLRNESGEIIGVICVVRDITARKLAETELRENEERFRALSHATFEGLMIHENDIIVDVNNMFMEMFGYGSREEVIGRHWEDALQLSAESKETIYRRREMREEGDFEVEIALRNGEARAFQALACDFSYLGRSTRAVALKDITERKLVEKKTKELEAQLLQAQKMEAIGNLASSMAHDFNNLLGIIMGHGHLLLEDTLPLNGKSRVDAILESALRGKDLTKNLTLFANDMEINLSCFNLNYKLTYVINWLEEDLSGIKVDVEYGSGVDNIFADAALIENTLINMIKNAAHALSKTKNPSLKIKTYADKNDVRIEMADNGCGIPVEFQGRIFDPMFSLKGCGDITRSYRNDIKGSGYGLANVKKWIDKHHGYIEVESEFGKGSKFKITLPEIRGISYHNNSADECDKTNKTSEGKRILIVEDEPELGEILRSFLDEHNHNIDLAIDGNMALNYLNDNVYDIISLDYILPGGINGMTVYQKIRAQNKRIPIVFVSGNFEFLHSIAILKEKDSRVDYLAKPFSPRVYVNKIHHWLDAAREKPLDL